MDDGLKRTDLSEQGEATRRIYTDVEQNLITTNKTTAKAENVGESSGDF